MDGELLKYLIYVWMLAVAGVGGIKFLTDMIGTARIKVTCEEVGRFKTREFLKALGFLILLVAILAASYFLAHYLENYAS